MCPHTNCTLIPEETQINGSALGGIKCDRFLFLQFFQTDFSTSPSLVAPTMTQQVKSPSTFGRQNSLLLKKHVKFNHGDKAKVVCCSGVIHPENILPAKAENGAHRMNNGHHNHMIEALPGKWGRVVTLEGLRSSSDLEGTLSPLRGNVHSAKKFNELKNAFREQKIKPLEKISFDVPWIII